MQTIVPGYLRPKCPQWSGQPGRTAQRRGMGFALFNSRMQMTGLAYPGIRHCSSGNVAKPDHSNHLTLTPVFPYVIKG